MGASVKPAIREFLEATGAIQVFIFLIEKIPASFGIFGLIILTVGSPAWMIYRIAKHKVAPKDRRHLISNNKHVSNFVWSGYWIFPILPFAIRGLFLLDQITSFFIGIIWIPLVIVLSWWMAILEEG